MAKRFLLLEPLLAGLLSAMPSLRGLIVVADSMRVGSFGPDRERGTEDDIIAAALRRRGG